MSQSKYFGKSFVTKPMQGEGLGGYLFVIGEHPGVENFIPNREHFDEALTGLVDTLRVTRKLLKEVLRQKGIEICAANEFNREMVGIAKKIGESVDDVSRISKILLSELFEEMVAKQTEKKS